MDDVDYIDELHVGMGGRIQGAEEEARTGIWTLDKVGMAALRLETEAMHSLVRLRMGTEHLVGSGVGRLAFVGAAVRIACMDFAAALVQE